MIELRSPSNSLAALKQKMLEYMENGTRLGWLIAPEPKQVHIYRPDRDVVHLNEASKILGDPELSGFVLDLRGIWSPGL